MNHTSDIKSGASQVVENVKGKLAGMSSASEPEAHAEGKVALKIEQQTAKLPSDFFLWAAFSSIGASAFLQLTGRREQSNFVGQWAPTFLILGLYNKLVKVMGSDRVGSERRANAEDPLRQGALH